MLTAIISTVALLFVVATIMDGRLPKKYYMISLVLITLVHYIVDIRCAPISYTCRLIINILILARYQRPKTAIIVAAVSECCVGLIVAITGLLLHSRFSNDQLLSYQAFIYPSVLLIIVIMAWYKWRKQAQLYISKLNRKTLIILSFISVLMIPFSFHQVTNLNFQVLIMTHFIYICLVVVVTLLISYYIKEIIIEEVCNAREHLVFEKSTASVTSLMSLNQSLISLLKDYVAEKDLEVITKEFEKYCPPSNIRELEKMSEMLMVKGLLYSVCTLMANDYHINLYIDETFHIDKDTIDEKDLYLVLSIFIDNAVKYSQGNKIIQITMLSIGDTALISIENTYMDKVEFMSDNNHNHHSLVDAKRILSVYKEIEHQTFRNNDFIVQRLILKQRREA